MADFNHTIGLNMLPKTYSAWEFYKAQDYSIANFIQVTKFCAEELATCKSVAYNLEELISDLEYLLKKLLSELSTDLIPLLILYKQLIHKNIIKSVQSGEMISALEALLKKKILLSTDDFKNICLEVLSALFFILKHNKVKEASFESSFDAIFTKIVKEILIENNIGFIYEFFQTLDKSTEDQGEAIIGTVIKKRNGNYLVKIIKNALRNTEIARVGEEKIIKVFIRVITRFIKTPYTEFRNLKLRKVCLAIIHSNLVGKSEFISGILESLCEKGEELQNSKNRIDIIWIIVGILLLNGISQELYSRYFGKLSSLKLNAFHLSEPYVSDVKTLILSSRNLMNRSSMLNIITPFLKASFSVIDLKLSLRFAKSNPAYINQILQLILSSLEELALHPSYIQTHKECPVKIPIAFSLATKELSIWAKILPDDLSKPLQLFQMEINRNASLFCIITTTSFSLEMIKNQEYFALAKLELGLTEGQWNTIGVCISQKQKLGSKFRFIVNINSATKEVYIDSVGEFKEISSIQLIFSGKLAYFKVFSEFLSENSFKSSSDSAKTLSLDDDCARQYYSSNIIKILANSLTNDHLNSLAYTNKAQVITNYSIFSSLAAVGGVNCLIGLLKYSENSSDFETLFRILIRIFQYNNYSECLKDECFECLRAMILEKAGLINNDWLVLCIDLLMSSERSDLHSIVFNKLILCSGLWVRLNREFMHIYLEVIVSFFEKNCQNFKENEVVRLCKHFHSMINGSDIAKDVIARTYFKVLRYLITNGKDIKKLEVINKFLSLLQDEVNITEISAELKNFIVSTMDVKWKIDNSEQIFNFITIVNRYFGEINITLQKLTLMFLFVQIEAFTTMSSSEVNSVFYANLPQCLLMLTKPHTNQEVAETIITFILKPKVILSPLVSIICAVTSPLFATYENSDAACESIVNRLISSIDTSDRFAAVIINEENFPGWVFPFIERTNFEDSALFKLMVKCFSHLPAFTNYLKLRILGLVMISCNKISLLFTFLKEINIKSFSTPSKTKTKYLIDFFNLVEDLLGRIEYEQLPKAIFVDFTVKIIENLNLNEFSLSFPRIPAFSGYIFLAGSERFPQDRIILREGGFCRQMLRLLFLAMSFEPNKHLEIFLLKFYNEKLNTEGDPLEWRGLESEPNVARSSLIPQGKIKSTKNLIYISVFTEWVEIIKSYIRRQFGQPEIQDSIKSLFEFSKKLKVSEKLRDEIKSSCDKQGLTEFDSIRNANIDNLAASYIRDNQSKYDYYRRSIYGDARFNQVIRFDNNSDERLKKALLNYAKDLHACRNEHELAGLIETASKSIEIEVFLIVLTSLKLRKISSYYFMERLKYSQASQLFSHTSSLFSIAADVKHSSSIADSINSRYFYTKTLKNFDLFCGYIKEESGKFHIKASADLCGRRLAQKNPKTLNGKLRKDFLDCSDSALDTVDERSFNSSYDFVEESLSGSDSVDRPQSFIEFKEEAEESIDNIEDLPAEFECEIVYVKGSYYGRLNIFEDCIIFISQATDKPSMPVLVTNERNEKVLVSSVLADAQIKKNTNKIWFVSDMKEIIDRRYVHNPSAVEIFFDSGRSVFLNFFTNEKMKMFYNKFRLNFGKKVSMLKKNDLVKQFTEWKLNKISNFDYLMILNKYAGRSFNDYSQYPVFPWVLKDYQSPTLDLKNEKVYRDLRYSVCAQEPEDRSHAKRMFLMSGGEHGSYNYGSHYLSGGVVLHYLIRIEPFTQENLNLHNGFFDVADRLFSSIEVAWQGCQSRTNDTKELIPEFFYLPEMFVNVNREKFGTRQNGSHVDDVELPKWARNSVFNFLNKHRKALESAEVSKNLHHWIDLIFGYKQQNSEGETACNIFHPITYENKYKKMLITSAENYHFSYFCQAYHFGQTPQILFNKPHHRRENIVPRFPVHERLLSKYELSCTKKANLPSHSIVLTTSEYLLILKPSEKVSINKYKWLATGIVEINAQKDLDLAGSLCSKSLKAAVYQDEFIVTCGYYDNLLYLHDLNGKLVRVFKNHTMQINCLIGGSLIITASQDSSVSVYNGISVKPMQGHISPVVAAALIEAHCVLATASAYILIHDYRSGEVLKKLNESCILLSSSPVGIFCVKSAAQLKLFFPNGSLIQSMPNDSCKSLLLLDDCILLEKTNSFIIINPFEPEEFTFGIQEPLEVMNMIYCEAKDCIFIVNHNDKGLSLYCVEASHKDQRYL